jgi:hypothetical protein
MKVVSYNCTSTRAAGSTQLSLEWNTGGHVDIFPKKSAVKLSRLACIVAGLPIDPNLK